jgi:hypothetical protein
VGISFPGSCKLARLKTPVNRQAGLMTPGLNWWRNQVWGSGGGEGHGKGERGAASSPVSSEWRLVCINTLNRRLVSRSLVSSDLLGVSECRCHLSFAMLFSSFSHVMVSDLLVAQIHACEHISIVFILLEGSYDASKFQDPALRQQRLFEK